MIETPKPISRHPLENTVTVTLSEHRTRHGIQNKKVHILVVKAFSFVFKHIVLYFTTFSWLTADTGLSGSSPAALSAGGEAAAGAASVSLAPSAATASPPLDSSVVPSMSRVIKRPSLRNNHNTGNVQ